VRGPNFTKLGGRSSLRCTFVSEFGYLAALSNAGGSKLSDVENDALYTLPVKIRGGVGETAGSINEALPTTKPPF